MTFSSPLDSDKRRGGGRPRERGRGGGCPLFFYKAIYFYMPLGLYMPLDFYIPVWFLYSTKKDSLSCNRIRRGKQ